MSLKLPLFNHPLNHCAILLLAKDDADGGVLVLLADLTIGMAPVAPGSDPTQDTMNLQTLMNHKVNFVNHYG